MNAGQSKPEEYSSGGSGGEHMPARQTVAGVRHKERCERLANLRPEECTEKKKKTFTQEVRAVSEVRADRAGREITHSHTQCQCALRASRLPARNLE